jgi:hypothetical protein
MHKILEAVLGLHGLLPDILDGAPASRILRSAHHFRAHSCLVDSVASDATFSHAVTVPFGFAAGDLKVPLPNGTSLSMTLRDDPSTAAAVALPLFPDAP